MEYSFPSRMNNGCHNENGKFLFLRLKPLFFNKMNLIRYVDFSETVFNVCAKVFAIYFVLKCYIECFIPDQRISWRVNGARVTTETPQFTGPIDNLTVALGREAVLSCTVADLGNYKVSKTLY